MDHDLPLRVDELHDIIDEKIATLLREMEASRWSAEEVVLAINDVIKKRWLDRPSVLHPISAAVSQHHISDDVVKG